MDIEAICRLPVKDIASQDAALIMWFTDEHNPEALRVVEAWGFTFKLTAALNWVKTTKDGTRPRMGLGYHTRKCSERALLATRGNGLRRADMGVSNVILAPRREHSRKPDEAYEALERLYGDVRRVELFARRPRPGWTSWGNEIGTVELADITVSTEDLQVGPVEPSPPVLTDRLAMVNVQDHTITGAAITQLTLGLPTIT
jgi:N6-adenosine-specific RNA methylase IME4